jgi:hypothetical protein
MDRSSDSEDVLVVSSEPSGEVGRAFTVESPHPPGTPPIPADLATEAELVKAMESLGYRLNMVGGGSRIDEVRRFYFRKVYPERSEGTASESP